MRRSTRGASRRSKRGFSLVEVLVASTLFLTTTAVIVASVASASRQSSVQRHMTTALQVAEQQMEELLLRFSNSPELSIGAHTRYYNEKGEPLPNATNAYFTVTWDVAQVAGITSLRRLTLSVSWDDHVHNPNERTHTITLTTDRP